jgi:chemotaxis protein methyltransferase CheR
MQPVLNTIIIGLEGTGYKHGVCVLASAAGFDSSWSFCNCEPMDTLQFRILLEHMGLSWKGYRKVRRGAQRRVARHMEDLGCRNVRDYLKRLDQDAALRVECERLLTVPISRFFRDRPLWQALENTVLPELLDQERPAMQVWSAGCSRGEEIYSFAILWEKLRAAGRQLPPLGILATDLNPQNLEAARRGVFGQSSLKEVSADVRGRWFRPAFEGGRFAIDVGLKAGITWVMHDLRDDPPDKGLQLIFLRNSILTYCREETRTAVLSRVIPALSRPGFLAIGCHERLPNGVSGLAALPQCRYLFKLKRC